MQVAEGLAHVYPRLAPTWEWDTAAAQIIVEEAGGSVVQAGLCDNTGEPLEDWEAVLAENKPVEYNKANLLNPFFVAYGKRSGLHQNSPEQPES
jgi:3'(2'), 5'-bisphosphate nucleotidase